MNGRERLVALAHAAGAEADIQGAIAENSSDRYDKLMAISRKNAYMGMQNAFMYVANNGDIGSLDEFPILKNVVERAGLL